MKALREWIIERGKRLVGASGHLRYSPTGEVEDGARVELLGKVVEVSDERLTAPLSGRRCLAYKARIDESTIHNVWTDIAREQAVLDFELRDETGAARIVAANAVLRLKADEREKWGLVGSTSAPAKALLARHRQDKHALGLDRQMRSLEGVLCVGDKVRIVGMARWEPVAGGEGGGGYRVSGKRLLIEANDEGRVQIISPSTDSFWTTPI